MSVSFQSAPSRGRRRGSGCRRRRNAEVSIRAFARKATLRSLLWICAQDVSIRAFARKATSSSPILPSVIVPFQSAPSRGRRPKPTQPGRREVPVSIRAFARKATVAELDSSGIGNVSIRAFARKATRGNGLANDCEKLFQSAPSRGRRRSPTKLNSGLLSFQSAPSRGRRLRISNFSSNEPSGFNPRLREEGDQDARAVTDGLVFVSIRAFARKATSHGDARRSRRARFQSAPSRGRRPTANPIDTAIATFQSAPSRGRRQGSSRIHPFCLQFQSAPSRGRRRRGADRVRSLDLVSIRAFARKATTASFSHKRGDGCRVSIRAFARKATRTSITAIIPTSSFNPRLREEGDKPGAGTSASGGSFQSAPSRGRRRDQVRMVERRRLFQSAPSRGRRPVEHSDVLLGSIVSIRAFARKATSKEARDWVEEAMFQSAPSRGRRPSWATSSCFG